ncbi:c-type cytochrome [bacterium AH-315-D21]|nr:c-type cytochrome [bacterium AH-315-D21]
MNTKILQINTIGLIVLALVAAVWIWQSSVLSGPREIVIDVPRGTAELIAKGADVSVIPEVIHMTAGDKLVLMNNDIIDHRIGGFVVAAGAVVRARFQDSGTFGYICSVHPTGQTVIEVAERVNPAPMLWTALALLGVLAQVNGIALERWGSRRSEGIMAFGWVALIVGIVFAINSSGILSDERLVIDNPVESTPESVAAGSITYGYFCSTCHGDSGLGDGPLAAGLDPPPADLLIHVPLHSDGDLFRFVQEGIPGSSMPPLSGVIYEPAIWHLVNYLRTME